MGTNSHNRRKISESCVNRKNYRRKLFLFKLHMFRFFLRSITEQNIMILCAPKNEIRRERRPWTYLLYNNNIKIAIQNFRATNLVSRDQRPTTKHRGSVGSLTYACPTNHTHLPLGEDKYKTNSHQT